MLAGRPHEAAGNGSPRWMAAGPRSRGCTEPGLQAGSPLTRNRPDVGRLRGVWQQRSHTRTVRIVIGAPLSLTARSCKLTRP